MLKTFHSMFPVALIIAFGLASGGTRVAAGQALPTAKVPFLLSGFGGVSGTYTGLQGGRNADITAGFDVGFLPLARVDPTFEVRGSYAVDKGGVDGLDSLLVGLRLGRDFGKIRPYGNILVGRGSTTYVNPYPVPGTYIYYTKSDGTVISPGFGVELEITRRLAFKLDGQYQRFASPVSSSNAIYAKQGTVGVVYRIHFKELLGLIP